MFTLHSFSGIRKTLFSRPFIVALTWISGLLTGVLLIHKTSVASLMCSVHFTRISIVGFCGSLVLPFLLSYILFSYFHFYYILPLVFLKAFSFMYCYSNIMISFGNAGWLVVGILLLSDCYLVVSLLHLWLNAAFGQLCSHWGFAASYILPSLVVGCFDYFIVSTYVSILFNR